MYAGAAREAVFAVPAVIKRIQADFVPLALRAPAVNAPQSVPDEDERWLYERVNRAKLAPQGICVLDARGQVLTWVQMFDSDQSVLDFLGHSLKRFREKDAARPAVTERFMKFPTEKMAELRDMARIPVIAAAHAEGKRCAAAEGKGKAAPGSLHARLVGRALNAAGKPVADTVKQEHYVEDQLYISPDLQNKVTAALANAGSERTRVPDDFCKLCAGHAHLGHIDVRPCLCMIPGKAENPGEWKRCDFWAKPAANSNSKGLWQIDGNSEVVSELRINGNGSHNVKLQWQGFVEVEGGRIARLILSARGTEKLQFARDDHPLVRSNLDEVAVLPAGRPVDQEGGVRYGIIGIATKPEAQPEPGPARPDGPGQVPDEARKQLVEVLGGPFIVFRDKVQQELKLTEEKKQKLLEAFPTYVKETMELFEKIQNEELPQREKAMQEHRRKSHEKLSTLLEDVLDPSQRERLFQIQLHQAGVFALLGENQAFAKLKITDEQRKQFMNIVEEMHKKIEPLVKKAQSGGNPAEILPKVMRIRRDHESRIQAVLSEAQREEWRKLVGKPFEVDK